MTSDLHYKIINVVGKKNFLISDKEKTPYITGWRTEAGECEFVVLPDTLLNMWTVLKLCIENNKYINSLYNKYLLIRLIQLTDIHGGGTFFSRFR